MRRLTGGLVLLVLLVWAGAVRADPELYGRWLTADREGVVEIFPCGTSFCGRIVGMAKRIGSDGTLKHDPQGHPQCGLVIIRETEQSEPNLWRARIENPDDGQVWRCELWVEGNVLHLRGYVLITLLGRTTDWTRYSGRIGPQCLMS